MRDPSSRERLTKRDWTFLLICFAILAASIAIIATWFTSAFPEASIDFRYDRNSSKRIADAVVAQERFDTRGMKHTVIFDSDDAARIFLERSLGLKRANAVMKRDVRLWYWHHRWFRPLQEEEMSVEIAPTGELVAMARTIPESRRMPLADAARARQIADAFLARAGATNLELISQSERQLPARVQRIFTWRSRTVAPAGAEYRYTITVDGDAVSSYGQRLKVPDQWLRGYHELRSKNAAAGNVDIVFLIATMVGALAVFITRMRRGDLHIRFLLILGLVTFVLRAGSNLNSFPTALTGYDTTTSYAAFVAQFIFFDGILDPIGKAMLIIVICAAGEILYRERFPQHLATPRLWTTRALESKRVFRSLILGYTLVAFFIAYQTIFYVIADKFGAWAPAEIPYDNTLLNTSMPWLAVLFAGFFPAMSEEFLSRAFSIPFFERIFRFRSTIFAIVLSAYIWGFGHSTYPNQPFYIRGLEVGSAGVVLGFLLQAFGFLPLLIWHYTVDAIYTALMLLRSGNLYYVLSGGIASMIFVIPLLASVVLYVRKRGFAPDDALTNASLPVSPAPPVRAEEVETPLPDAVRPRRWLAITCVIAVIAATLFLIRRPTTISDVVDYRTTTDDAKRVATTHMRNLAQPLPAKIAAVPVSAFRSWDPQSGREEGGSPGRFDDVAATYMVRHGMPVDQLVGIMRTQIPTAMWMVRFFTPMQKTEYLIEVNPRTARVTGYHKYVDEKAPGARLDRNAALAIALRAFPAYSASPNGFDVKEALTFEQPNRRDWLFHFEQRQPLAGEAVRRVSVRVMGGEVTQFATTVKVPDAVYRAAHEQTFVNFLLFALRVIAAVTGLALIVSGFIMATRHGLPQWRRAARITALIAVVPIARILASDEYRLFTYSTTTSWDTFMVNAFVNAFRDAGLQILLIAVAVAAIFAVHPYASRLMSRESRVRFGLHALLATLATFAILISGREVLRFVAVHFPAIASVSEVSIPEEVYMPVPLLLDFGAAVVAAVIFAAAASVYAVAVRSWKHPRAAAIVTSAIIFCITVDSSATLQELPMTLITSAALAVLTWVVARYVLNGNPLAWPLFAFTASLASSGMNMMANHRADLQTQGWILIAAAIAALAWSAWDYRTASERFFTAHAPGD